METSVPRHLHALPGKLRNLHGFFPHELPYLKERTGARPGSTDPPFPPPPRIRAAGRRGRLRSPRLSTVVGEWSWGSKIKELGAVATPRGAPAVLGGCGEVSSLEAPVAHNSCARAPHKLVTRSR